VPVSTPEFVPAPPEAEPADQLMFEVTDTATGQRIERGVTINLYRADRKFVDVSRGRESGRAITFNKLIAQQVNAYISLPGYQDQGFGPIDVRAEPQVIRVALKPLYVVTIRPGDVGVVSLRVFSEGVPEFPLTQPYSKWETVVRSGATFLLPPGKYWCHIPRTNPRKHPDHPTREDWLETDDLTRNPGLLVNGCGMFIAFEVVDRPLELTPEVVWPHGTGRVGGVATDAAGMRLPDLEVVAIRFGAGSAPEIAQRVHTDAEGSFAMSGLPAGDYRVQPDWDHHPCQPEAFAHVSITDESNAHVSIVHEPAGVGAEPDREKPEPRESRYADP
jgi:hypothetical protein